MKRLSFRVKIIATLVTGITLYSVVAFTIYSISLKNKLISNIEENIEHINLLRDQYYFSIEQHDGTIIRTFLKNLESNKDVLRSFIIDGKLKVVYPDNYRPLLNDTARFGQLFSQEKDISLKTYMNETNPYTRVFIRMQNTPSCHACHNPAQRSLGMIVLDLSNRDTEKIISNSWRFSFFYTLFLLLGIFILVAYLHYRYIRSSLSHFRTTITLINQGKLDTRLAIPEVNELGSLGRSFNDMLSTFERTQIALSEYHQKEMENAQKLATIGEMSARIAHEIRNPVTGIARALDIILPTMEEGENKPILEEIQRQTNRVEQAISNLLKYSRTQDVVLHEGNINEVIKSLVFFLKHQSHEKQIDFLMDLGEDIPTMFFDNELLENVLLNLSFNSINAIRETGMVKFRTSFDPKGKKLLIALEDNGTGIPEEIGREIFKPFYTTHTKGTGLGLAISRDIVEKHKGEIWYRNNESQGCTFFISLPVIQYKQL